MSKEKEIDNHRFIVVRDLETPFGTLKKGMTIVVFRNIACVDGYTVEPSFQALIKQIVLKAEEEIKQGKTPYNLREHPFLPNE